MVAILVRLVTAKMIASRGTRPGLLGLLPESLVVMLLAAQPQSWLVVLQLPQGVLLVLAAAAPLLMQPALEAMPDCCPPNTPLQPP